MTGQSARIEHVRLQHVNVDLPAHQEGSLKWSLHVEVESHVVDTSEVLWVRQRTNGLHAFKSIPVYMDHQAGDSGSKKLAHISVFFCRSWCGLGVRPFLCTAHLQRSGHEKPRFEFESFSVSGREQRRTAEQDPLATCPLGQCHGWAGPLWVLASA